MNNNYNERDDIEYTSVTKTITSILSHSWWMSQWLMTDMDVTLSVQTDHSHRLWVSSSGPPQVLLRLTVPWTTSGREYDDFTRLFFLYEYFEVSILTGELPEESEQFRFFWVARLANGA